MLPSKRNEISKPTKVHWYSVLQLALSVFAIFSLWAMAFLLALLEISGLVLGVSETGDPLSSLMLVAVAGAIGLLLLPSAVFAFRRVMGRETPRLPAWLGKARFGLVIFALPLVLLLGHLSTLAPPITWLILPPMHVLAVGIPVFWVIYIGVRGLPLGSPQRMWGVLGSGLVLGPMLSLIAEVLVGAVFFVLLIIVLATQPDLTQELTELAEWVSVMQPSPEMILEEFAPYIMRPAVIFSVFLLGAVIVPMLEEIFKPIGVWLLVGRKMTPAAGFAAGVLSGAGFALMESLAVINGSQDWAVLVVARIGTAVVHILTAGATGWGLTVAWRHKRFLFLFLAYLAAVLVHGLWNGISLMTIFSSLAIVEGLDVPGFLVTIGAVAPAGLVVLTGLALAGLLWANRKLKRDYPVSQPVEVAAAEEVSIDAPAAGLATAVGGQQITEPAPDDDAISHFSEPGSG